MRNEVFEIKAAGSLPEARLITYLQDYYEEIGIKERPLVLICPGGGYGYTSAREGEAFAMQFLAMGYHAAVLKYSCAPAVFPTALTELALAMRLIRDNAQDWNVAADKILVLGCSAGGHLAASLGTLWDEDFLARELGLGALEHEKIRPDGLILCYPVITAGEFAHRGSFQNLLGEREKELAPLLSLETRVTQKVPPVFLWHTYTDASVPVENSLLFLNADPDGGRFCHPEGVRILDFSCAHLDRKPL